MKTEKWMEDYLERETQNAGKEGYLLQRGAMQMYDAFGKEQYLTFLKEKQSQDSLAAGSVCSFLYQKTGTTDALDAVEALKKKLANEETGEGSAYEQYLILPFYMECETRYGKKEQYNYIIGRLEAAQNQMYDAKDGLFSTDFEQTAYHMMTLIEVMDAMNIEIYELYRTLQDAYKALLKEMLKKKSSWSAKVGIMVTYTMLCGCRMNILLKEKYATDAVSMLETYSGQLAEEVDADTAGIFMMAYAQKQMLQKEMEA